MYAIVGECQQDQKLLIKMCIFSSEVVCPSQQEAPNNVEEDNARPSKSTVSVLFL